MNSAQCLQFLRPYAYQRLSGKKQAYLSIYDGARQHGVASRAARRCLVTASKEKGVKHVVEEEKSPSEVRSHAVAARIEELSQAKALVYPRIQRSSNAMPMRIPTFREKYRNVSKENPGEEEVVLHGRLQSVRRASSKLVFLDLTGEFEHVQAMCNFRKLEPTGVDLNAFKDLSKLLRRGDLISITGKAIRTQTGELSVDVTRLPQMLSPSLVPLPFKLEEEDAKVQNRHIDMLVNRETADVLRLRSYIMKYMRDFFHKQGFLEFQTPILAENAGGAVARPFTTTSPYVRGEELSLRIAPELWLKRLVVGGVEKVFEIGPAFRNEGIDLSHNPEFTMCEFYNAYASLPDLIGQTEELISGLAHHCQELISTKLTSLPKIDLSRYEKPYKQLEFIPSLEAALGFALPDLNSDTAQQDLVSLLQTHNIPLAAEAPASTLPKLLDKLAGEYLEPHSASAPLFITHHPACMSPLSKSFPCPKTGQLVSARTELFVGGRELANMYEEENDPFAQRRKFAEQARRYRDPEAVGEEVVVDESYVQALESGLPPTGGWGCGVERLVMLFSGARRISDTLSFGNLRNVVGLSGRKKV
ncbi:lysyl-tRNA synthetase-like protein [Coniochaeta ligniaria NRRL 30616]|uniref:Lysyl-tRNA synthetase n=1 Tax=Coniochaeta ligniaria NRRL 30616 TaxID=1408157 RepID=A0A1J7I970_9PEZI|nr:lysyl-tRNA synthetase-like protein [Coniochaeta ligniaria NRRL 30616]